ncbi:MAG: cytochrome P450 [Deltaproteobacteria bacterium]|nr:cytochrome P450 [Deltaproteobacteria bacterium]
MTITRTSPRPPGPAGRPVFGNAREFRRDPLGFLAGVARDYGDVVEIRLGPERMLVLSRPEDIEDVLVTRPECFRKSRIIRVIGRLVLGVALDATDGEQWRRQRRWAVPAFRPARLEEYGAIAADEATRAVATWRDGEARAFHRDALRLMLAINARVFCGVELADAAPAVADGMVRALDGFACRLTLGIPVPDWLPAPCNLAMRRGMAPIHRFVRALIAARRAAGHDGEDLLSILLAARDDTGRPCLTDAQLVDEVSIMFALGAHQESLALAWGAWLLARHPEAERRLHVEIDDVLAGRPPTPADPPRLPYTAAVVDEILRLYPPFFLVVRESLIDGELGGHRLDKGTSIGLCTWVTQRHPRYFVDPDAFRPERWLDGLARRLPRFAYFPFGGGPRVCIANAVVRTHLTIVLATIAQRCVLRPRRGHVAVPDPVIGLGMRGGLPVTVERRAAVARSTAA